NRLIATRVRVDEALAQVETDLQRRHDLVGRLASTVAAAATHERRAIDAVLSARTAALRPPNAEIAEVADADLQRATAQLIAVAEDFPDLRADGAFSQMQAELADTESRLAFARDFAAHRIAAYHERLDTFPSSIIARLARFEHRTMFVADHDARHSPAVSSGPRDAAS
ncbi:MAG: LemA family protein, partial [Nitriliruptoraceae bacterium]